MNTRLTIIILCLFFFVGCTAQPTPTREATTPAPAVTLTQVESCVLPTIVAPTPPAEVAGYAELDPTTGLHVTGTIVDPIDLAEYRLEVTGLVGQPLSLTYDDLRCMPKVEVECTLVCPGFFQDDAAWAGASLPHILQTAQVSQGATGIKLVSADGYVTTVDIEVALRDDSFLAYEWEGEPLPIIHGFPVRAVFPELDGNKWAKWLVKMEVY